jgi:hypothetical protein
MKLTQRVWHGYYREKGEEITPISTPSSEITDSHGCSNFWAIDNLGNRLNLWFCEVDEMRAEYAEELLEYHADLTKTATNGEMVTLGDDERYTDSLGRYGYSTHFTGAYVCYTCGHLCECGDDE